MSEGNNRVVSAYNEASLQTQRLHFVWISCNSYKVRGELDKWRWELNNVWSELSYDVFQLDNTKDLDGWDDNKYVIKFKDLDSKISLAFKLGNRSIIYSLLLKKESWLRILLNMVGKGSKYVDDTEDEMEE